MHRKRKTHILVSWIMIGALAVGMSGCSHNKDSSDVDISSEEISDDSPFALQGHNEDAESNLGAWGRAMGSVLIAINDGSPYYFGGYAISDDNEEAAANILKESWGITNRKSLLKQINDLLSTGSRKEYLKEAREMQALSDKKLKKAMNQLTGNLLIHYELTQRNWENWGERGLLAWDMCRISHLVQWGYIAGYLENGEAQTMIEPAAKKLKKQFDNWDDVIMNWLDGYALAAAIDLEQSNNDYETRKKVYESLVAQQSEKGPLYDDSLFSSDIVPLSDVSYQTILEELEPAKKKKNQGKKEQKGKKEENQNKDNLNEDKQKNKK